jgi:hypothetical protein
LLCHATSQNPQDSKIRLPGFDRFKFQFHSFFAETFSTASVKLGRAGDVRCTTALRPKADVHPRSCYVAFVPILL